MGVNQNTYLQNKTMPKLNFIMPFFIVSSLEQSVSFYREKLGFKLLYTGPEDDPYWAIVGRDNISMMLKAITPDIQPVPNNTRHEWARWDAYISTDEPEQLFEEYRLNGVDFFTPLQVNSDNLLGFEIKDADGYILYFGRPNL